MTRKTIHTFLLIALALVLLSACAPKAAPAISQAAAAAASTVDPAASESTGESTAVPTAAAPEDTAVDPFKDNAYAEVLTFDNGAWNYDADNDVNWQIGVRYAAQPETLEYETLGIYVPGAYLTATANGDGTYTAALNEHGSINGCF